MKVEAWSLLTAITRAHTANKIMLSEYGAVERLCGVLRATTDPAVECMCMLAIAFVARPAR